MAERIMGGAFGGVAPAEKPEQPIPAEVQELTEEERNRLQEELRQLAEQRSQIEAEIARIVEEKKRPGLVSKVKLASREDHLHDQKIGIDLRVRHIHKMLGTETEQGVSQQE